MCGMCLLNTLYTSSLILSTFLGYPLFTERKKGECGGGVEVTDQVGMIT